MAERPTTPAPDASAVMPLAVDAKNVSRLLPFALRTWRRMDSAGICPRGFKVGGKKLWLVSDLQTWAAAGFPSRAEMAQRPAANR